MLPQLQPLCFSLWRVEREMASFVCSSRVRHIFWVIIISSNEIICLLNKYSFSIWTHHIGSALTIVPTYIFYSDLESNPTSAGQWDTQRKHTDYAHYTLPVCLTQQVPLPLWVDVLDDSSHVLTWFLYQTRTLLAFCTALQAIIQDLPFKKQHACILSLH